MAVTSMTVTIADVPFRLPSDELAAKLRLYMDPSDLTDVLRVRSDWPGPNLLGLGLPAPPPPDADIGLGCFWYPWGMSRYGIYRGIMGVADVDTLGGLVSGAPEAALDFVMEMPDGTGITTPMFVLPPRQLVRKPNQTFDNDGNSDVLLYLVTLVDERFLLGGYGGGKIHIDATTYDNWSDLIDHLVSALGITLSYASVDPDYFRPEPDSFLYSNEESAAALLDAVAANIGRVVVRNLDGTYQLQTYADATLAANAARRLDGGISSRFLPRLWGGSVLPTNTDASTWRPMVVPEPVVVTFPKWITGAGYYEPGDFREYAFDSYGDVYQINVMLADLGSPYSTWTPGAAVKIIRLPAKAEFAVSTDPDPTNLTDATTLAQRVAKDFYDSQMASLDETYQGIVNRAADGACDVLWCAREETVYTRATRRPFEWGASHRQNGLSALEIPNTPGNNSVDNVHVVNVYDWTDPDNPVLIGWQCERVTLGPAGGTWPPQVVVPRVVYETVYESENRDPRLRDEPAGFPVGPPDPTDPADATHIIPLFRDEDGNDYIVFWATNTSYTEDVVTYAWDVSTCVLTPTTTNYTITLTVTPPGTPFTGLTLDRFLTPPPPP